MKAKQKIQKLKIVTRDKHILNDYKKGPIENKLNIQQSREIINNWKNSNTELSKKIDHFLNRDVAKVQCSKCGVNRWMFCVKCDRPLHSQQDLAYYKFPIDLVVYRHSQELNTKSSTYSLKYFTDNSTILEYPKNNEQIKKIVHQEGTYVLYPHKDSVKQKENCI